MRDSTLPTDRPALLDRIYADLQRGSTLRARARQDPQADADRLAVRAWQTQRLAQTYRDLLDDPRYRPAAEFFLSDLYGAKDAGERDAEAARILPTLAAVLPVGAVQSLALALELDALSEELDGRLVAALRERQPSGPLEIDAQEYAAAYRACDNRSEREMQIELVDAVGHLLDRVAHRRMVGAAMEAMRGPARLAGLGALHDFLERGLRAFRYMQSADGFLAAIRAREEAILERLMSGAHDPFAVTA
jgi:hypothetical protein